METLQQRSNLVQWEDSGQVWSSRDLNEPRVLDRALETLSLPTQSALPLLPGQAWHLKAFTSLANSSRLAEILHISTSPLQLA